MHRILRVALLLALMAAVTAEAPAAGSHTVVVRNSQGFARAAAALRHSGGTIVLRPGTYPSIVLGPRSGGPLRIVGAGPDAVRVGRLLLWRTRRGSINGPSVRPAGGDPRPEMH